jgi:tRNA dimethylallyltransferase
MNHPGKKSAPVILGPTASGKTPVGVKIAELLNSEVISADSRLVYRQLDIGTAKPTAEEMGPVPHHLIDIVNPDESFSVADYQSQAYQKMAEIFTEGKIPVIVGGTGLYIRALENNPSFQNQPPDDSVREKILEELDESGTDALYAELKEFDPSAAEKIHPNNIPRLVRALEVIRLTGRKFSEGIDSDESSENECPYKFVLYGLKPDRELLYTRINDRVDKMIADGWVEEVRRILDGGYTGNEKPLAGLGYRDMIKYVRGECTLGDAVERVKRDTRRFAKRQMTWFRSMENIEWMEIDENSGIVETANKILENFMLHLSGNK